MYEGYLVVEMEEETGKRNQIKQNWCLTQTNSISALWGGTMVQLVNYKRINPLISKTTSGNLPYKHTHTHLHTQRVLAWAARKWQSEDSSPELSWPKACSVHCPW